MNRVPIGRIDVPERIAVIHAVQYDSKISSHEEKKQLVLRIEYGGVLFPARKQ